MSKGCAINIQPSVPFLLCAVQHTPCLFSRLEEGFLSCSSAFPLYGTSQNESEPKTIPTFNNISTRETKTALETKEKHAALRTGRGSTNVAQGCTRSPTRRFPPTSNRNPKSLPEDPCSLFFSPPPRPLQAARGANKTCRSTSNPRCARDLG